MSKVIILGASNAIPTMQSENTHMVIVGKERMLLIDSVSNPILRLEQAGLDFNDLTDIIVTHFHPDHASGIPLLLMDMWLMGRQKPLNFYGLHYTLDRVEGLMGFYNWSEWPNFFPVVFHRIPSKERALVLQSNDFIVHASPVHHMIPNIGLRVEFPQSGKTMAYSCDTEPCDEVVRLSEGVDVLIHEATGESEGHSSATQAGETATKAEAGRLYLIHYPTGRFAKGDIVAEAGTAYQGEIQLAKDFMTLEF
ncbi:MAG TPA: MBL fold metallo-hydrolase [Anaerolineales bacterium]|nr:MBL fold metallo-hydrolase [Anaerolineales bacterium]HNA89879.1 MBL fold metallo-hydrolase [Anaerolineales bacterium]HNB35145.1 MBL fold metallo-hydrolase [Anaerolineales bacterium]HNC07448.1 MBL fold metallo-hydrolase [Anaerolineales bacterium]